MVAVAHPGRFTRRGEWHVDAPIIAALFSGSAVVLVAIIGLVQFLKGKRIDANQALIERLTKEIDSLRNRQDSQQTELVASREKQFALQHELIRQEASFNEQIALLKDETRAQRIQYEQTISQLQDEIVDLKAENESLRAENLVLKDQLAESSVIGGIERRHGEVKTVPVEVLQRATDKKDSES